jgi:hypothetical protein
MPKSVAQMKRCLMIADRSGRRFFTQEANLMPLLEFAKTFSMDLAIVNVADPEILELTDLPKMICDTKTRPVADVEVLEQILPTDESKLVHIPLERTRSELIRTYREVRLQIQAWFVKGCILDMKYLRENLEAHELSDTAIRNQFNKVKQEFIDAGWTITSPKKGSYVAAKPAKSTSDEWNANFAELLDMPTSPVTMTTIKPSLAPSSNYWGTTTTYPAVTWTGTNTYGTSGTIILN